LSSRTLSALTLAVALIGANAPPVVAQPAAQLLPAQSEIVFTTKQMGVPVEGRFGKFSASIALDPRQPATGRVAFTIDTGSARFGAERDAGGISEQRTDALAAAGSTPTATGSVFRSSCP
jgi:polyisoprenoid-binding protein YceI